MRARLIAKKQARKAKPTAEQKKSNGIHTDQLEDNLNSEILPSNSDSITAEQLSEIKSLHRTHDRLSYEILNTVIAPLLLFVIYLAYQVIHPGAGLRNMFFSYEILTVFILAKFALDKVLFTHPNKFSAVPSEAKLKAFSYEEADNFIQYIRELNSSIKSLSHFSSFMTKIVTISILVITVAILFSGSTLEKSGLFYASSLALSGLPNLFSKAKSLVTNHGLDNKLIDIKRNLNEITSICSQKWQPHKSNTLDSSYFVLNIKYDNLPSKVVSQLIANIFRKNGLTITAAKNSAQVSVMADIAI